jgi:hypothetical protein
MFWSPWFFGELSTILTSTEEQSSSRREWPAAFKRIGNEDREWHRETFTTSNTGRAKRNASMTRGSPTTSGRLRCDLEAAPDLRKIGSGGDLSQGKSPFALCGHPFFVSDLVLHSYPAIPAPGPFPRVACATVFAQNVSTVEKASGGTKREVTPEGFLSRRR